MHCTSHHMKNYWWEVWNLIDKFKAFNIKSIPHTYNASIDMLNHNVRLEYHFDLGDIFRKTWKYEFVNEDTKYLWRKLWKILLSSKLLVKMKFSKLLATRIIVSVHARKGRTVRFQSARCQLTDDIWLHRNYDNHIYGGTIPCAWSEDLPNCLRVVNSL